MIDIIVRVVSDKYNVREDELRSKKTTDGLLLPRQVALFFAAELTSLSGEEIGTAFCQEVDAVERARNKIKQLITADSQSKRDLALLRTKIKRESGYWGRS